MIWAKFTLDRFLWLPGQKKPAGGLVRFPPFSNNCPHPPPHTSRSPGILVNSTTAQCRRAAMHLFIRPARLTIHHPSQSVFSLNGDLKRPRCAAQPARRGGMSRKTERQRDRETGRDTQTGRPGETHKLRDKRDNRATQKVHRFLRWPASQRHHRPGGATNGVDPAATRRGGNTERRRGGGGVVKLGEGRSTYLLYVATFAWHTTPTRRPRA